MVYMSLICKPDGKPEAGRQILLMQVSFECFYRMKTVKITGNVRNVCKEVLSSQNVELIVALFSDADRNVQTIPAGHKLRPSL